MLGGNQIFTAIGMEEPEFVVMMRNNQVGSMIALFLLNNVGNSMLATGAFEIYLDGMFYQVSIAFSLCYFKTFL